MILLLQVIQECPDSEKVGVVVGCQDLGGVGRSCLMSTEFHFRKMKTSEMDGAAEVA